MRFHVVESLVVALLAAPLARAQIVKKGDGYLLRTHYSKGQKLTYDLTTTISIDRSTIKDVITVAVVDVQKGVRTITYSSGRFKDGPVAERTVKVSDRGRVLQGSRSFANFGLMNTPEFPSNTVRVGESWIQSVETTAMGSPLRVTWTYQLQGFRTVSGQKVAEVTVSMTAKEKG